MSGCSCTPTDLSEYITKDVIDYTNSSISLSNIRRITNIKRGVGSSDAVTKSQMESYSYDRGSIIKKIKDGVATLASINNNNVDFQNKRLINIHEGIGGSDVVVVRQLNQEVGKLKRSVDATLDNVFLPQLNSNDTLDFKNKRITNIGDPVNPQDVVSLNYFNSNRITKVHLTKKFENYDDFGSNPFVYTCLYDGVLVNVVSDAAPVQMVMLMYNDGNGTNKGITQKPPFNFKEWNELYIVLDPSLRYFNEIIGVDVTVVLDIKF